MKDEINNKITEKMFKIFRGMKNTMSFESKNSHLTMIQLEAMIFIYKNKELQMRDLAQNFSITMPTATSLVDKLIKSDYVIRTNDRKDRRIVRITLTKEGKKFLDLAIKQRSNKISKLFSTLSDDDKNELLRILKIIV